MASGQSEKSKPYKPCPVAVLVDSPLFADVSSCAAAAGEDQRLRFPRFLDEEQMKDPEATKQDLVDKIAQLNDSIDEVAAQLRSKDSTSDAMSSMEEASVTVS